MSPVMYAAYPARPASAPFDCATSCTSTGRVCATRGIGPAWFAPDSAAAVLGYWSSSKVTIPAATAMHATTASVDTLPQPQRRGRRYGGGRLPAASPPALAGIADTESTRSESVGRSSSIQCSFHQPPGQDAHAGLADAIVVVVRVAEHLELIARGKHQMLVDDERRGRTLSPRG